MPASARVVAALDRTKEPGSAGEPLYQDVLTALAECDRPARVTGGRYGLSSKEFTPAMVAGVFDELSSEMPRKHFTVGIRDDVTHLSLDWDPGFRIEPESVRRAVFWGLGSDGTVGANKNTIKIIAEGTDFETQGYFVYDSRKAGARTVSHLRFGPDAIRSPYLIEQADFVAVHQFSFLSRCDTLAHAAPGATLLLNAPYPAGDVWERLPQRVQEQILELGLEVHVIDAYAIARDLRLGARINTIMQACFFQLSGILEPERAAWMIEEAIRKTYGKRGEAVVEANIAAARAGREKLQQLEVPAEVSGGGRMLAPVPGEAPAFVRDVLGPIIAGRGDELPVSALPVDGTFPSGTAKWEKRSIAAEVPVWEPDLCIQCGKCVLVCPHAVIRGKVCEAGVLEGAPEGFEHVSAKWRELPEQRFTLQVAPEDCTGCSLCVEVCPAKDKSRVNRKALNMTPKSEVLEGQQRNWDFFRALPEFERLEGLEFRNVKNIQLLEPLFEFSGACAGCGETPYLKLLTQLFGDRAMVANATGCSSIYGGNLPTTPWSKNREGRGPAWSNSLFEDNAEFGLGMRIAWDAKRLFAEQMVDRLREILGRDLPESLLQAPQTTEREIAEQRERVARLKALLRGRDEPECRDLLAVADALVRKDVWIVGGDGWAYDIGYGGLDHVLAGPHNVNVLVLDTEVYSNTGGQASKSTSMGAVAKFASGGKAQPKKDLAMLAMSYGHVYVAQVAMGASDVQTVKAFLEAEAHPGPSLIIAYSHCIAHGIDLSRGLEQQKKAERSGHWPLFRYDPGRADRGENPFQLDSKPPSMPLQDYLYQENRYRLLKQARPQVAKELLDAAQAHVRERWETLASRAHAEVKQEGGSA